MAGTDAKTATARMRADAGPRDPEMADAAQEENMPTVFGSMRRLLLTPQLAEVTFARRGFPAASSAASQRLEAIPQAVICGFEWGIDARDQWEVERRLDLVDAELRGFAYEGVTMAFTVLDAMGRGHRTRDLLLGPGRRHVFLAYIGMGFAMARLPRRLWPKVVPDLTGDPYYPTMSWLAVDGYGFDRAYFDTPRWVDAQKVPAPYRWEGSPDYFLRAVDQGIGRALWFICGGHAPDIATAVGRFAPPVDRSMERRRAGRGIRRRKRFGRPGRVAECRRRRLDADGPGRGIRREGACLRRPGAGPHDHRVLGTGRHLRRQGGRARRRDGRQFSGFRARLRAVAAADTSPF
jgi:Protein of unknown function (DUF1702)